MERINMNQWMKRILEADKRFTLPIMTHPGIELSGHTVGEAVRQGEIHAQAIRAVNGRFPSVAATMMMDLTVEAEAFGCPIEFPENDMPHILNRIVDATTVDRLPVPSLSAGRIPEYLKAARMTVQNMPGQPLFAGAIAPFSLAGRLFDISEIMVACYIEPDAVNILLEKCTRFITDYCNAMKAEGCSGVILAEPAAGLLSNDDCMQFSSLYVRKIVEQLQDEEFLVVLHNCGNTGQCTPAMLATGAHAYHFGNAVSMTDTLAECPPDVLVMGNIDPVGVLRMLPPEQVKRQTRELLEQTAGYPNFVLSTGCDVPPHVPLANIEAYYEALDEFNSRKA